MTLPGLAKNHGKLEKGNKVSKKLKLGKILLAIYWYDFGETQFIINWTDKYICLGLKKLTLLVEWNR